MKKRSELLNVAKAQKGKGGAKFRAYVHLGGGQPWCDAFAYWLYNANGCGSLLPWKGSQRTYCPDSIKWCKKYLAQVPPYLALPCDIVYFDWEHNGIPNHVGIVYGRISTSKIKTLEGNTSGGIVDIKNRNTSYVQGIFRTHFPSSRKLKKCKLDEKNTQFGYLTIYNLQLALGMKGNGILTKETVKYLQRKFGATPDGAWSVGTSKAIQKKLGIVADGAFGAKSICALKKWVNTVNFPVKKATVTKKPTAKPKETKATKPSVKPAPKPAVKVTSAQKILAKAKELAWAYGTAKKKYDYKTGSPKAVCTKAMKKYGWADSRAELSDCGNFASTVVRESGVSKTFKALHGAKTPFPKAEKGFSIVLKGKKVPAGFLKAGDIIRYKKKNGNQHVLIYYGNGKICEASHHNRYGAIIKDEKKYNNSSIAKISTVQVLRPK